MVDEPYALCRRMTGLENYRLVTQSQVTLEAELNELTDIIDGTDDLTTRQDYEDSCRALQGRIEKHKLVSTELNWAEAQLVGLSNELERIMTEVTRLQAMGADEAERHVNLLVEKLREEMGQLETFERETVRI